MTLLAKRYATALHALATQQHAVDALHGDLAAVHAALQPAAARALITSPDVNAGERGQVLDKLAAGRHPLLRNLIGVLQHRRRLAVLFDLFPAWKALVMASRGEVDGVVESAMALADDELQALTALAGRLTGKKVHLTVAVRPDLLGGVRLRVGNVLYDGSLRASLDQLGQKLQQSAI
jgi:F-type H+-transporting ATPase subunit delta